MLTTCDNADDGATQRIDAAHETQPRDIPLAETRRSQVAALTPVSVNFRALQVRRDTTERADLLE